MRELPKMNCQYGAPMGRADKPNMWTKPGPMLDESVKFSLRRVRLNSGGYDSGGAYWGIGKPLYWASNADGTAEMFFRASTRGDAKTVVRERYPNARFWN